MSVMYIYCFIIREGKASIIFFNIHRRDRFTYITNATQIRVWYMVSNSRYTHAKKRNTNLNIRIKQKKIKNKKIVKI